MNVPPPSDPTLEAPPGHVSERHVFESPHGDIAFPDAALTAVVLGRAKAMPDAVAMIDGASGARHTFTELDDAIRRLAGGLAALGVGPGDRVALMAPNSPEFAIVFHAVALRGAAVTTVNPTYGAEEIRFQLEDAAAMLLVTVPPFLEAARAAMKGTAVTEVLVIGESDGHRSIADVAGEPLEQEPVDAAETIVALPYSSGTTGLPKGVMLTHRNLVANIAQTNAVLVNEPGEVALAVLPFFHIFGMQVLMNALLADGVTVVTLPRFDMGQVLALIEKHRINHLYCVPPIVLGLAKSPAVDEHELGSLKRVLSGAAPLGAELAAEASARIGCTITQGYGMTEMSPVSHAIGSGPDRPGSSGQAVPGTRCRVVAENGRDVGAGEVGELLVQGPQVMKGYLGNPEASAATLDAEGWLHTGDVVTIDADGYLFVVDRVKELIKVKAFQVAPAELEALLVTHPAVADVAVIGVADEEAGERPKAFVVVKPDASVATEELRDFLAERVASYKRVTDFTLVESIPKSPSGKILRRLLRDA